VTIPLALALSLATVAAGADTALVAPTVPAASPTEVVVLATIHDDHLDSDRYGLPFLEEVVRAVAPDDVMVEVSPDSFRVALAQWVEDRRIREPSVARLPEIAQVVIPLSRTLDFRVVPVAAGTAEPEERRLARVEEIRQDPGKRADWFAYQAAWEEAEAALEAGGAPDDPLWIHTEAHDQALEIALGAYDRLFGEGGRDPGRALRDEALDELAGQGRRVLVLLDPERKGTVLRRLRERGDVRLLDPLPFLEEARQHAP